MNTVLQTPTAPMQGSDVWCGPSIKDELEWIYHLSETDILELRSAMTHGIQTGKTMQQWEQKDFPLQKLASIIDCWTDELNRGRGFKLMKAFPVLEHSKEECAMVYWGMGLYMRTPVSQNADGDLLADVRDTGIAPEPGVRVLPREHKATKIRWKLYI